MTEPNCEHCGDNGWIWGTPCSCQEKPEEDWKAKYLKLCYDVAMSYPKMSAKLFLEVEPGAAEWRDRTGAEPFIEIPKEAPPVLDAIRLLVDVNGVCTPDTILRLVKATSFKKTTIRDVLEVISKNKHLLRINDGKIYGTVTFYFTDLVKHGKMKIYRPYTIDDYGYHLFNALEFEGEDDLKTKYRTSTIGGGISDVHHYSGTKDCPELREELHARGYVEFDKSMCDIKNFWKE